MKILAILAVLAAPISIYAQTGASQINTKGAYTHSKASVSVQSKLNNITYATDWPGVVPDAASALMTVTAGSTTMLMTGNNSLGVQFSAADVGKSFGFPGVGPSSAPVRLYQEVATAVFTDTYTVAGSVTSGTFTYGETVVQTSTGVTVATIGLTTGSTLHIARPVGSTDASHAWVGQTSGAIFTPTALPVLSSSLSPEPGPANYLGMIPGGMPSIGTITADSSKAAVTGAVLTYSAWAYSSQAGSAPGSFDWEVDGSDDPLFGSYTVVYSATAIHSIDFGALNTLDQRDTFRIRFGVDSGPYFRYYRPQVKDTTAGLSVHPVVYLTGNTFAHVFGGTFTAYVDATHMTMSAAPTFTSQETYIPYGTDDAPGIQAAENDMCGGDATQDECYIAGTMHFPAVKPPNNPILNGGYFLGSSLAADYSHWIGDGPVGFIFSPAATVTTINGALCGAYSITSGCQTSSTSGGEWEQNTPVLIRFGNLAGIDSQGALIEHISVVGGNIPANIFYCQTCEEGSGTLNSSFSGNDGSQGARKVLILTNAAQNSTYRGMQNVANNNINPPPRIYLTSAITSTGSQTFTVNRTDWFQNSFMYVEWRLTSDPTPYFNLTVIDANCTSGACHVSGNITALHSVGDSLMTYWQPVSVEFIGTGTQNLLMDNNTITSSPMPGWGYGIRNVGSNIVVSKLHLESAFAGVQNNGAMVIQGIDGLYNTSLLIDNHGEMNASNLVNGSPPGAMIYFDGTVGASATGFSLDKFSSVNVGEVISGHGPTTFYGGSTVLTPNGAFIKKLIFGSAVGYPMLMGNQTSTEVLGFNQFGSSGGMYSWDISHDGGNTYPQNLFTIDTNGWFHPQILTFGDQRTTGGSCSTYYGHDSSLCIPILKLGANISSGLFAFEHTGSSGSTFNFLASHDGGATFTVGFSVDYYGNFSAPGIPAAPGSGLYNEPLYYYLSGSTPTWGGYSIPGLLNFLSNGTSLNVGNALGWDGSKLNNLTAVNLMTTLAGGASFSNAYSPTKWTGSALIQMTTANLGTFMGLGSSSTPLMMVYQGNTGAFTVQSIPTGLSAPASASNAPIYSTGAALANHTITSLQTWMFGSAPSTTLSMVVANGSSFQQMAIPPSPATCSGGGPESSVSGTSWACTTSTQLGTLLTGTAIPNNHVPRWSTTSSQFTDGGNTPTIGTVPTSHSSTCQTGTISSDGTYLYYCIQTNLSMRIGAGTNSITW